MSLFREFADRMAQRARDERRKQAFEQAVAAAEAARPRAGDAADASTMASLAGMDAARRHAWFMVGGKPHVRIPWGGERGSLEQPGLCPGCEARPGELHLPGCAQEECPSCGGKAMACACEFR